MSFTVSEPWLAYWFVIVRMVVGWWMLHAGPEVYVQVGPLDDWQGFYVADDGPGIPEADREKVFESGFTTAEDGTGFGLAIVQVIADAHGWDVRLTESESEGARFEFVGVEFE